jgi:hypothetical protein
MTLNTDADWAALSLWLQQRGLRLMVPKYGPPRIERK